MISTLRKLILNYKVKNIKTSYDTTAFCKLKFPIWKNYWCKQCRWLLRDKFCYECHYLSLVPSNYIKIKGHLLILKGTDRGIHNITRETSGLYWTYNKSIKREVGYIKKNGMLLNYGGD